MNNDLRICFPCFPVGNFISFKFVQFFPVVGAELYRSSALRVEGSQMRVFCSVILETGSSGS
jgi:hypothetical protein